MSVIVAIKKDNKVYFGADTQTTKGSLRTSSFLENNFKLWKVKGVKNCIMGSVGSTRDSCVIKVAKNLIDEIDVLHDNIDYDYVVEKLLPRLVKRLEQFGYTKNLDKDAVMDSTILFGYKDKLYLLSWSGCVTEIDDCVAIGSGGDEALGSLSTTVAEDDAEMRVIKAIKSSIVHDIYVNYPLVLIDTGKMKFKVMTEESIKAIDDTNCDNYNKK